MGSRFGWAVPRLFVDRIGARRTRRASDVLILILAAISLVSISALALPRSGFELGVARVLAAIPNVLDGLWRLLLGLASLWAGIVVTATLVTRRWRLSRDVILAVVLASLLAVALGRLMEGAWMLVWDLSPQVDGATTWVPALLVVGPIAVIATVSPFVTHGFRLWGIGLSAVVVVSAMVLSVAPYVVLAGASVAVIASSSVHLLFGSTKGWPDLEDVEVGLDALGVTATSIEVMDRQNAGVFQLEAIGDDDTVLSVKVYGRDAADTQFLTTMWRRIVYRGLDNQFTAGRLHQVEHEAYLTLMAGRTGLAAQEVVIGGPTPTGDAILVLRDQVTTSSSPVWDETAARSAWQAVDRLHAAGIAHGHIEADTVLRSEDGIRFKDFRTAVAAPESWRLTVDRVQVFVLTVLWLGADTATDVAREVLGREVLLGLLPLIQPAVLPNGSKAALRSRSIDIDDLRKDTAHRLDVDPPELERLRRVTVGSVLKAVLPLVGFFALASVFAGLDVTELANSLAGASWWMIVAGLLVAQFPRVGQAMSALGASPVPLPLGRLYLLQLAQSFIYLTIPNAAARVAMNVRFLQRHGLPGGTALAVGALDGFTSFITQILLLVAVLVFSSLYLDFDFGATVSTGLTTVAVIIAVVVVVAVVAILAVPRWRTPLFERSKGYLADAREAVRGLGSPRRLGLLLGGAVLTELLFVLSLGVFVMGLGFRLGFPELILIYTVAFLLGSVLPVPGGIGVIEGGLVLGLVRAGLPEEAAFAATILFRAATYYLPPIWGYPAFSWLGRNKYL